MQTISVGWPGSPKRVKAQVVPMRDDISVLDVAEILRELHLAGLIVWYELNGELYIQFPKFDEHQTGLHKRTASKLPAPPPGSERVHPEVPGISRNDSSVHLERGERAQAHEEPQSLGTEGPQALGGETEGGFPEIPGNSRASRVPAEQN